MEALQTEFKLKDIVVICRSCGLAFATSALVEIPPISDLDHVEADLHRVLPDVSIRAALVAVCPDCHYAAWTSTFRRVPLKVELVTRSECPPTQKFALAVKSGRDNNLHPLDLAFIALNGCWAARESGESDDLWLELAAFEHARGLADNPLSPEEDGLGHLMMAEIWRQSKQFERAVRHYELALRDDTVPKELIVRQRMLAKNSHSAPTLLPAAMVRQVFMAVASPDVIYADVEEFTVPPVPAQKAHEKLGAALGVTQPATAVPVKTAGTVPVNAAPVTNMISQSQAPAVPNAVPATTPQQAAAAASTAMPVDRSSFVQESFRHTGNGTAGASDDSDVYSDVMPVGKEQVILPEAPAAAAILSKVESRVHSHYFRRPSSPAKEEAPSSEDEWITDFDRKPSSPAPARANNEPESYESEDWEKFAAVAAANNAQALAAEEEAFEAYQNQAINSYVAAQASATMETPAPVPVAMRPAVAQAVDRIVADFAAAQPGYERESDDEYDDEYEEDDIPIEQIIPAITLTGDVNAAPLKKKKRRRQRFAVSAPQALAPAVNYAAPPQPNYPAPQPHPQPQPAYAAPMPQANYAMAAPADTYESSAPTYQAPPQPQAADTDESGGAQMDVSDAVARVESYLALSQQARRINWLRGYRAN